LQTGFDFEHLIRPLTLEEFANEYWERKPLVVQRDEPDYYTGLFSMHDVDHLISSTGIRYPGIRLVKSGSPLPTGSYTSNLTWGSAVFNNLADPERVVTAYQDGATLILQALQRTWKPLARFCRNLETYFNHPVQANAYLTPDASQGFKPHYDTHDVLVLQIAGHKHWRIYDAPVPLPDRKLPYSAAGVQPGDLLHEFVIQPGDLIYMPRGFIHEALTTESESLHITVGIVPYTWMDVFAEAVQLCRDDSRFRRALPLAFAGRGEVGSDLREEFYGLLDAFRDRANLEELLDSLADRFVSTRAPLADEHLLAAERSDSVGGDSRLKRREGIIHRLSVTKEHATLLFNGKRVAFPSYVEPALRYVISEREFKVHEIAGTLDTPGKITLVRRLIKEGFLTVV
jgi:ribosomal protein L16 Arg81 hydroxylase